MIRILLIALILYVSAAHGESLDYKNDIGFFSYNSILKSLEKNKLRIKYNDKYKVFDFYIDDAMVTTHFSLSRKKADKFIKILNKYEEWNKKAIRHEITLKKEISKMDLVVFWNTDGEWFNGDVSTVELVFFSQSKKRHQLVMIFPKANDMLNEYMSFRPNEMYFDEDQVKSLKKALLQKSVDAFIAEYEKKKKILEEFK